jgi:hypothetical protein
MGILPVLAILARGLLFCQFTRLYLEKICKKNYLILFSCSDKLLLLQQQSQKPARYRAKSGAGSGSYPRSKGVKLIMTKKQYLKPWAVARLLPHGKWAIIGRYRNPSDADGHLLLLRQQVPNMQFKVVFDLGDSPKGVAPSNCKG